MKTFEQQFWSLGYTRVLGMDEAGRGPLAGPVAVAGVIFDPQKPIPDGINDSKKLSEKKREELFDAIINSALDYKILLVPAKKIDEINILNAVKWGMMQIAKSLNADALITDAVAVNIMNAPQIPLVKGDSRSVSVAAASILAKVARDRYMKELAKKYPEYGFEKHAGYPTKEHFEAIKKYGITKEHRKSYSHTVV